MHFLDRGGELSSGRRSSGVPAGSVFFELYRVVGAPPDFSFLNCTASWETPPTSRSNSQGACIVGFLGLMSHDSKCDGVGSTLFSDSPVFQNFEDSKETVHCTAESSKLSFYFPMEAARMRINYRWQVGKFYERESKCAVRSLPIFKIP